jgi:hypothetical protein
MSIEGAATGENGQPIVKMVLYADNKKIFESDNYNTFDDQSDYSVGYNGQHHLVLNAWDSAGNLLQASEYVTMVGGEPPLCGSPQSGIRLCSPQPGSYQPSNGIPMVLAGSNGIQGYDMYLNGQFLGNVSGKNLIAETGVGTVTNKPETFKFQGYDTRGQKYTVSTSFYVYYDYVCNPKGGCSPGVLIESPQNYQDVNSPFTVSAEVHENPKQITAMKAYLDNKVVASSTGPTIRAQVEASAGSHLLTVEAWDTTGALYKSQQTVNVY